MRGLVCAACRCILALWHVDRWQPLRVRARPRRQRGGLPVSVPGAMGFGRGRVDCYGYLVQRCGRGAVRLRSGRWLLLSRAASRAGRGSGAGGRWARVVICVAKV